MLFNCFLIGLLASLVGCTLISGPRVAEDADLYYKAVGRVAARVGDKKPYATRFRWTRSSVKDDIYIFTALGNGLAQISMKDGKVLIVTSKGDAYRGDTPEKVITEILGWSLPVKGLQFWLIGRSDPRSPVIDEKYDDFNRIVGFSQQGWSVHYAAFSEKQSLPKKIVLNYDELKLRIIIDRWVISDLNYILPK